MKTFMASPATIERKWYVIDATGLTLGRLCSEVAKIL
ncbi:MAG: uL13 family ribosomal protein, partial [Clostridium sp.]|nr:uL13 family ribosomal protein [Clostridium sp.]MBP3214911.1 uL13 family ribosomal protein [Clostridium sp.]